MSTRMWYRQSTHRTQTPWQHYINVLSIVTGAHRLFPKRMLTENELLLGERRGPYNDQTNSQWFSEVH